MGYLDQDCKWFLWNWFFTQGHEGQLENWEGCAKGTEMDRPRETGPAPCTGCPAGSLGRRKGFLHNLCLLLRPLQHHCESKLCWWSYGVLGSPGLQKSVFPVRLPYISYDLWCLGLFFHQHLKQVVLDSSLDTAYCKIWRLELFIYQHLPLQAANQFPFLQMALTGQPKKALLAICFLLSSQAG